MKLDLFDDDKRLALKPVVAFNAFLLEAFAQGACSCIRCQKSNGNQEGYTELHTFEADGRKVARQFTKTLPADVESVLKKAYKAFYKAELPALNEALLGELQAMANHDLVGRVRLLLEVSGLLASGAGSEPQAGQEPEPEFVLV
ncbi:hypothetical protein NJC40_18865 [Pseudomonas sp. 21LCFQ02]|uniref:hypothetical protein n=1 Tax=unclassified Pseudomonas TaxID=196821 RepID=UPI00209BB80B|nr:MULTISPECIES: hypothetical protein [unclassified Pseudomonas]MCO8165285.1 hypothetical protein [Pseudomonas sp. 21LCFQ010]MCO8169830.1 hypothetical protein [Pseudomonas sp. 21LCFQ02]MCQ9425203.1 hypothetical protein [Pseudomonas sp. LJDD11]